MFETSKNSVDCAKLNSSSTIYDCSVVELQRIENCAGNITVLEAGLTSPFPIGRVYYLYDIPGGTSRGGHAHRVGKQLLIAASGSFEILLNDGQSRRTIFLNRPYYGLLVPAGIWMELHNFSSGSICLVAASHAFDATDYLRDYRQYASLKNPR